MVRPQPEIRPCRPRPEARLSQHRDGITVLLQDGFDLMHAIQTFCRAVPEPRDSAGPAPVETLRC